MSTWVVTCLNSRTSMEMTKHVLHNTYIKVDFVRKILTSAKKFFTVMTSKWPIFGLRCTLFTGVHFFWHESSCTRIRCTNIYAVSTEVHSCTIYCYSCAKFCAKNFHWKCALFSLFTKTTKKCWLFNTIVSASPRKWTTFVYSFDCYGCPLEKSFPPLCKSQFWWFWILVLFSRAVVGSPHVRRSVLPGTRTCTYAIPGMTIPGYDVCWCSRSHVHTFTRAHARGFALRCSCDVWLVEPVHVYPGRYTYNCTT